MKMKFRRCLASFLTVAMTLSSATISYADGTEYSKDDFFTEEDTAGVHYTIAGNFNDGNPLNEANEFEPTVWENVYSKKVFLFTDSDENLFKIYRVDETSFTSGGEAGVLCLGTNVFDEAQTHFKVANINETDETTIFFDAATGAVVVLDSYNSDVNYSFSWVGDDQEEQYTTVSEFTASGIVWPEDKVKVALPEDMEEQHKALFKKVTGTDLGDESLYQNGEYNYTVAGGSTGMPWQPASSANQMKDSGIEGVLAYTMTFPAYDEETEWLNRFKICRLDDITCEIGWLGSICLGTTVYDGNQTSFRVENEQELKATIYLEPATGAVVILDEDGNNVDYKFSWVGYDNEVQYTTVSEFAACGYEWPADKVFVDALPNIAKRSEILYKKIMGTLTDEDWKELKESEPEQQEQPVQPEPAKDGIVTYHFYNAAGWEQVGAWIREGTGWEYDVLPLDKCVLKDTDDGSTPHEPIWPGAKMEEEGGNWYKITCKYDNFSLGTMMIFNNYVGESKAGDVTSEADIQKLRDAGITLNDVKEKVQTPNIMIKKKYRSCDRLLY